jgi:outer membrane protein insertion porin family
LYLPARCAPAGLPLAAWSSRARLRASARRALALLLLVGGALGVAASSALAQAGPSEAQRPIVAVLPFEVHSAKPIDYLGVSLANLLRARLEAGGEVLVLSAEEVASRVARPPAPGESDAALRAVAREIGADALVSGRLTELAGHFSLDVKLVPAAEGSRPQSFVLTADREEDLLARTNEVADAVVARTTAAAAASVVRIEIVGADELEAGLRERLVTRVGEPLDPAQLREDLAMLRSDPAFTSASSGTEREPDGVVVRFQVVRAERVLAPRGGARGQEVVAEVQIRGNRRIEADAIRARISTRAGERYRGAQVAKDVREVHALGFFRDVRVVTEESAKGRIVIFEVEENPVVRQISITGNESVDSDKIRDVLTLTTGATLDYPLLFENRGRIESLYRAEGFYLADVGYEVEPLGEASVGINFLVDEGSKLKLRKISFHGNEAFTDSELREGFRTKKWRWYSYATSWFDNSGTYSEPLFLQDLNGVQRMYGDAGYLQVHIGEPNVVPSKEGIDVAVTIEEGRQFHVGEIDVTGDDTVDIDAVRQLLSLEQGAVFNRSWLTADVRVLTDHYADRGYYFASVSPLTNVMPDRDAVDVAFQIRKGPLYFIREIDISGNTITVDPVIRREVQIAEGQLYSQRQINLSRARIEQLGFFEEVNVEMEPTDQPEQLDMKVALVERPTGSFSFGAGYSSQDGFVGTGSLSTTNLFGRGYAVNFSADVGSQTQRFFASFADPYFLGSDFEVGVTGFRTSVRFESFDQDQTGGELIVGHALSEDNRSRGWMRYSFASRRVDEDNNVNAASLILRELFAGSLTTSLVGLSFNMDTRDDRLAPTKGLRLSGSIEGAGLGGFSQFARAEGRANWYLGAPRWLLDRSTFVVGARIGYAIPFNVIGDFDLPAAASITTDGSIAGLDAIDTNLELPLSERYFLGGLGSFQLRGFKARSVGPRRAVLYEAADAMGQGLGLFLPVGSDPVYVDSNGQPTQPNEPDAVLVAQCTSPNTDCNQITDKDPDEFADLDQTDVIGGNKFISTSLEYRFPISETLGLLGVVFFDTGNAFAEDENLFAIGRWRYGTGVGVQWLSPFGPLGVVLGFPLDKLSVEDSPVFEFSVGGRDF